MNTHNEEKREEQDFPQAAPGSLKKVPKKILVIGGCVVLLLFMTVTFPKKRSKPDIANAAYETQTSVDDYESQAPVQKDPFETQRLDQSRSAATPVVKSTAPGRVTGPDLPPTNQPNDQDRPAPQQSYDRPASYNAVPASPVGREITRRLDNQYQNMVTHFKGTSSQAVVPVSEADYRQLVNGANKLDQVEKPLQDLTEDAAALTNKTPMSIPAGTRIRAITLQDINSDHPGYFMARIRSPQELSGYQMLCQSRGNARDRIPVEITKIISPTGREKQLPGEVQMNYAGLEGEIRTHYARRLLPPIASAFIGAGAGFLYFKAIQGENLNAEGQRINTADGVIGPSYQAGVQGVQNEIERLGGDYPNTVKVPEGTAFEVLVTQAFEIAQ